MTKKFGRVGERPDTTGRRQARRRPGANLEFGQQLLVCLVKSWVPGLIAIVAAGALVGICLFISRPDAVTAVLGNEKVFEITYQFLLITVIGGAVALLYKQLDQRRETRRALREMHAELLQAFNKAKSVRRQLRARLGTTKSIDPDTEITAEEYEKHMELLGSAQLTFETYAKRAEEGSLWFWGSRKLAEALRRVEDYLNRIVKEYQQELSKFSGDPAARRIGQLRRLSEFIGPFREAKRFKRCFKNPNRVALRELAKVILR